MRDLLGRRYLRLGTRARASSLQNESSAPRGGSGQRSQAFGPSESPWCWPGSAAVHGDRAEQTLKFCPEHLPQSSTLNRWSAADNLWRHPHANFAHSLAGPLDLRPAEGSGLCEILVTSATPVDPRPVGRGARGSDSGEGLPRRRGRPSRQGPPQPIKWTPDRIHKEILAWAGETGVRHFPSQNELLASSRSGLLQAIRAYGGIRHWAQQTGLPLRARQERTPLSDEAAARLASQVIERHGRLPSPPRLRALGREVGRETEYGKLANSIDAAGGVRRFCKEQGIERSWLAGTSPQPSTLG